MTTRHRERALQRIAAAMRCTVDAVPHGVVCALDDAMRDAVLAAYVDGDAAPSWEDEDTPAVKTVIVSGQ